MFLKLRNLYKQWKNVSVYGIDDDVWNMLQLVNQI
jgi:hypothetical protein